MKIPPAGWHNSIPPKASNYLVLDWGYWIERIVYWTGEYWLVDNSFVNLKLNLSSIQKSHLFFVFHRLNFLLTYYIYYSAYYKSVVAKLDYNRLQNAVTA
jgi:hypothetical protein